MQRLASILVLVGFASLALGCADGAEPPAGSESGALVVSWSVGGVASPAECDRGGAQLVHLRLYDLFGQLSGDLADECAAFSTSVELNPGRYYGDAVLEAADGRELTTAANIADFEIAGRDRLSVPIDFPARSFVGQNDPNASCATAPR